MVCKENVVSWFRNLSSHRRVDVMYTLLNMCLPFEVRYLGTCIEDRGKRDYNDLRDPEYRANHVTELNEFTNLAITDTRTRRKMILYMALLHGCNQSCAVIFYKTLASLNVQEINSLLNGTSFNNQDDQPLEELLLLYTMGMTHPAFTYEQKIVLGEIFQKLQDEENRLSKSVSNERVIEGTGEVPASSSMPPPSPMQPPSPMPPYPEVQMRNSMMTGVPSGMTMPPPGICMPPGSEPMAMGASNPQYLPLGFPSAVSPMGHWPNQPVVMPQMNQMMYPNEVPNYPVSPLVSRQSSPSQSQSPSRNSSPMGRRNNNNAQRWNYDAKEIGTNQQNSNPMASTSSAGQPTASNTPSNSTHLLHNRTVNPNQRVPSREPGTSYSRHNNNDNVNVTVSNSDKASKQPPPPRLRSSVSGDAIRENKELPNFKGNLQNYSREEIRRLSDEDLRDIGLTPNAVGQLRNIVRSQTMNGLSSQVAEKKQEGPHHNDPQGECQMPPNCDVSNDMKTSPQPPVPEMYQPMLHHNNNHPNNHGNMGPMRRCYPTIPPLDPNQIPMYTAPPPAIYPTQNPCYACLATPVSGMQPARYPRCNAQHMYCLQQLQTLRLEENNRQCSHSSSSDSTGSRSPPETPPAAPWANANPNTSLLCPTSTTNTATTSPLSLMPPVSLITTTAGLTITTPVSSESYNLEHNPPSIMLSHHNIQPMNERPRHRKGNGHMMRHNKNQMMNGAPHPPVNMACVSPFPVSGPSLHSPMTFLPHGHVSLRPNAGLYPNFAGYRPTYPGSYQPNGEIMFPYPPPVTGSTPPPSTMPPSSVTVVVPTPQTYMAPAPIVPFAATVQPTKMSCYNCGSNSHLASDCKDQTMDDLTKRAPYRLDYTTPTLPGDCPNDK